MRKSKQCILTLFFLFCFVAANAQEVFTVVSDDSISTKNKLNVPGIISVCAVSPAIITGVYVYMHHTWWSEKETALHFDDGKDLTYALNLDKLGHYTASCLASNGFSDILRVIGFSENTSLWGGAALSTVNATIIELKDGYAPYWGFSLYDETANILGAFYPVLQAKVPFFKNINFKWSYDVDYSYNTVYYKYKVATESASAYSFIDDYDRQYFWMTFDWASIFCKDKPKYKFPYCIDFAIGFSGQNIKAEQYGEFDPSYSAADTHHQFFIGLDFNLTKLFKKKNVAYYVCKYANFYHLPMPALQVAPKARGYWMMY
jgi:hypothetical protein